MVATLRAEQERPDTPAPAEPSSAAQRDGERRRQQRADMTTLTDEVKALRSAVKDQKVTIDDRTSAQVVTKGQKRIKSIRVGG